MPEHYTMPSSDKCKSPERSLAFRLDQEVGLNPAQVKVTLELLTDHLQSYFSELRAPGDITHTAVAAHEPAGKPIKDCAVIPVALTVFHDSDIDIQRDLGTVQLRATRILRFCIQAQQQGALLSYEDLSFLLGVDISTIKDLVHGLRDIGVLVPTRGAIKDIGPEPSHKRSIAQFLGRGFSTSQVAAMTAHSETAIGRYQAQFAFVLFLLHKYPTASDDQLCQIADLPMKSFSVYKEVARELLLRDDCKPHLERLRFRFQMEPDSQLRQIPPGKSHEDIANKRLEQQSLDTAIRQTIQEELQTSQRVAETVTLDIRKIIDQSFFLTEHLRPGETTLFVDALQTSYISGQPSTDRKVIPVTVPIATDELKEIWRAEQPAHEKRAQIAVKIACAAQEQGGVMTVAGLAELLHTSSATLANDLRRLAVATQVDVPTKGTLEDAGPTLTHKDWIVDLDQHGLTGQEISWLTRHAPISRDRYIQTYRRAEIIMNLEGKIPDAQYLARTIRIRTHVAQQYVDLLRHYHPNAEPDPAKDTSATETHAPPS